MTGTTQFTINPGALDHFTIGTISSPQVAGTSFSITVTAYDANNNIKTDYTGPATLSDLSTSITPTSTGTFTNGVWTDQVTITKTYTNDRITATDSGKTGQSGQFTVSPGALNHFVFTTISSPQTAGTASASITITAVDAYGNTVTSYSGSTTLTETDGGAVAFVTQSPVTFTNGVRTGSLTVTKAGTGVTITATGGGVSTSSNTFDVVAGALSKFAFANIGTQTAGTAFSITITAQDQYGNTVTSYTGTPTLTYTGATAPLLTSARS